MHNSLMKEYEAAVKAIPKFGQTADVVLNSILHRFFIIILSSATVQ